MTLFSFLIGVLLSRRPLTYLTEATTVFQTFSQWFPFIGPLGLDNPHGLYNSPYTLLPNNTKSAVQLAYEYLTTVAASTTPKIHILTFDGTASMGGTSTTGKSTATGNLTGQDVFTETGGAYPAILGYRLKYGLSSSASTPTLSNKWVWHGIDYHPEYVLTGEPAVIGTQMPVGLPVIAAPIPTVGKNIARAVTLAQQVINSIPVGEKIVLSGLSQGSFASRVVYDELRRGSLQARKNDLIGVVNFGDACRPAGWSIPGGNDPGGEGACKLPMWLPLSQQWTPTGLIDNPDTFYWSFANPNDAAACVQSGFTFAGTLMGLLCKFILYGPPPNLFVGWGQLVNDWTTRSDYIQMLNNLFSQPLLDLEANPTIRESRRTNRSAVDRSALQTTIELSSTDPEIRTVYPATPIDTLATSSTLASRVKPVFFYAHGTAYTFGLGFEKVLGQLQPLGKSYLVPGLNGVQKPWNLTVPRDPFPDLVNGDLYEVVRISYPAATIAMGLSITIGATKVIDRINALPVGTPFALGGYSQGAAVMSSVLRELQTGSLTSRYSQFLGGVMFGNPRRKVDYRGPIGGTWSGRWDVSGSNTGGHGSFPTTGTWPRLTNPPNTWVEFAAPGDVFTAVGDSSTGLAWTAGNDTFLDLSQSNALTYFLTGMVGAILAATQTAIGLGGANNFLVDAIGTPFKLTGGGHTIYPFLPPPNADGSYNTTTVSSGGVNYLAPVGKTCYQLALEYLEGLANTWATVPVIVPPKVESVPGWQDTLTSIGSPALSAGWSTSLLAN